MKLKLPALPKVGCRIRHIPGWHGYAVTEDGRVFSCRPRNGHHGSELEWREKSQVMHPAGRTDQVQYPSVTLFGGKKNRHKLIRVHRLVLLAFVGPAPVGHIGLHSPDPNTRNNHLKNLKWGTHRENILESMSQGRYQPPRHRGAKTWTCKLTPRKVRAIRKLLAKNLTRVAIAKRYGVHRSTIDAIAHGKNWGYLK